MKTWHKLIVVCVCGAAVWGLSYSGSVWPDFGMVCASFATGVTGLCSIIAGWPAKTE